MEFVYHGKQRETAQAVDLIYNVSHLVVSSLGLLNI